MRDMLYHLTSFHKSLELTLLPILWFWKQMLSPRWTMYAMEGLIGFSKTTPSHEAQVAQERNAENFQDNATLNIKTPYSPDLNP